MERFTACVASLLLRAPRLERENFNHPSNLPRFERSETPLMSIDFKLNCINYLECH